MTDLIDEGTEAKKPRWAQQQRFKFIRRMLSEKGEINRYHLCSEFGISLQQASADIGKLARLEPGLMWYDKSAKRYKAVVTPLASEPSAGEFYQRMFDSIYQSCLCNHMTAATAHFLADLAVRVEKLERNEL